MLSRAVGDPETWGEILAGAQTFATDIITAIAPCAIALPLPEAETLRLATICGEVLVVRPQAAPPDFG